MAPNPINVTGHCWILREKLDGLKGACRCPELSSAIAALNLGDTASHPFVLCRVYPDPSGRLDWRRVQVHGTNKEVPASTAVLMNANPEDSRIEDAQDVVSLSHLNEPSLLRLVERRYARRQIYTRAGPVLVAINPFASLEAELYSDEHLQRYRGERPLTAPAPHVYDVAWLAYDALCGRLRGKEGAQSIVINGESGAGKTWHDLQPIRGHKFCQPGPSPLPSLQ